MNWKEPTDMLGGGGVLLTGRDPRYLAAFHPFPPHPFPLTQKNLLQAFLSSSSAASRSAIITKQGRSASHNLPLSRIPPPCIDAHRPFPLAYIT